MTHARIAILTAGLTAAALAAVTVTLPSAAADPAAEFELVGRYAVPGGGEVAAVLDDRLYVLNGAGIDIVDISDPSAPARVRTVDLDPAEEGWSATSVATTDGFVAVSLVPDPKTDPGRVVLLNPAGRVRGQAVVGANPDMVVFDEAGKRLLVANEGEPESYLDAAAGAQNDPVGSVSVIDVVRLNAGRPGAVTTIGFEDFNAGGPRADELSEDVRIFGPYASVAQDLEPEYITVEGDTAWVTLQENNAIATLDLAAGEVGSIVPLALKDHSLTGNGLDPSDREISSSPAVGEPRIATWPVLGMPMPDAVAHFRVGGETFLVTANEGDARQDWPGFEEEIRVGSSAYTLDPDVFTGANAPAELKKRENLGRLTVSNAPGRAGGNLDADPEREEIRVFGTRSATIWTADGGVVWDSGDLFERTVLTATPDYFNSNNSSNDLDSRSDNKGPEPEGVATGVVDGRTLAFVALERQGGFVVLDVTDPEHPAFAQYANSRDFTVDPESTATDSGPEVVRFVPAAESPSGRALVIVANEISGTVSIWSTTS